MRGNSKWMAALLSLVMAVGFLPMTGTAYAAEGSDTIDELAEQIQSCVDPFAFRGGEMQAQADEAAYPASYDLRNVNGNNYVTPVKFQNPFGTCWGFAAIAAAESSLLGSGLAEADGYDVSTLNLSEKHLVNFIAMPISDKNDPQYGEGTHYDEGTSVVDKLNGGGFPFYATGLFSSGMGPNLENRGVEYEYHGANSYTVKRKINGQWVDFCYSDNDDWSMPEEDRFKQSYVLKESYMLPSPAKVDDNDNYTYDPAGTNAIKEQLMEKRAVEIAFCADTSRPNQESDGEFISKNWAHYTYEVKSANHAVTIVGWDDSYPKENFVEGHEPPENGAWLVKNSWGSGEEEFPNNGGGNWGIENAQGQNTGYFWLSYYDQSLSLPEALGFDKSNVGKEYYLDQHDYMPVNQVQAGDVEGEVSMANVFKAEVCEQVEQISCQTAAPGTKVLYEVWLLQDDFETPNDGVKMASGEATFEWGGFHKIALDTPVPVQKGQSYAIEITQITPDNMYNINVPISLNEMMSKMFGMNSWEVGVINPKESYLMMDGEWADYSDENLRSKLLGAESMFLTADNFPIKGYCTELPNISIKASYSDMTMDAAGIGTSIRNGVYFEGNSGLLPGDPAVTWTIAEGSEGLFTLTPDENDSSKCTVTVLGVGTGYAIATAEGVGSTVIKVSVVLPEYIIMKLKAKKKKLIANVSLKGTMEPVGGQEISWAVKGKSKWKTKKIESPTAKITLKGLKSGKKYQVKIRSYYDSNGQTYYGDWSKVKISKKIK